MEIRNETRESDQGKIISSSEQPITSWNTNKKWKLLLVLIGLAFTLIVFLISTTGILNRSDNKEEEVSTSLDENTNQSFSFRDLINKKGKDESSRSTSASVHSQLPFNVRKLSTNFGLSFNYPENWFVRFIRDSREKLSLEVSDFGGWDLTGSLVGAPSNYLQIKVETFPINKGQTLTDLANDLTNKYLAKESDYLIDNVFEKGILVWEGKETFSQKERQFRQFLIKVNDLVVLVRAFSPNLFVYSQELSEIIQKLHYEGKQSAQIPPHYPAVIKGSFLGKQAWAAENVPPFSQFKEVKIMDQPLLDTFAHSSFEYLGQLAMGYFFESSVGPRLTTTADEMGGGAFIHSFHFDSGGNLLYGPLDTRVEFTTPYAGKYYLVINNFRGNREQEFKVRIEDRNQTDFVVKVKEFTTGAEFFFPHEKGLIAVPFLKFAYIVDYNGVIDPDSDGVSVYSLPGSIPQFNQKAFFPEEDEKNFVKTVHYKMDNETIFLYPQNEFGNVVPFPDNNQLVLKVQLSPTAYYIDRLFTKAGDFNHEPQDKNIQKTAGEQKTLIVLYNFQDNPNNRPFTTVEAQEKILGENSPLNSYYREISQGKTWFSGKVVGWYTTPYNEASCGVAYSSILHQVESDGTKVADYTRLLYIHPYSQVSCRDSSGSTGGNPSESTINGFDNLYHLIHELGHNLTLGHAHALFCQNKSVDRYDRCRISYYGDSFTPMGNPNTFGLSAFHRNSLGWLNRSEVYEATISATLNLSALESSDSAVVKAIKIRKPDTNEYYYLEYRQPLGSDVGLPSRLTEGALIHIGYYKTYGRWPYTYLTPETFLVDATPETPNDYDDVSFADGKEFYDESNKIRIHQESHDRGKVTLSIKFE